MVSQQFREGLQDAYAGDSRRVGFSRPIHAGLAALHGFAAPENTIEAAGIPRRGPLDSEAAKQRALVPHVFGVDRRMDEGDGSHALVIPTEFSSRLQPSRNDRRTPRER